MTQDDLPPISSDLRALADLEFPPRAEPFGRNVVKVTVLLFCIMIIACLSAVTFALIASVNREKELKRELSCVRTSAVALDEQFAAGMGSLINNDNTILVALEGVGRNDDALLLSQLDNVSGLVHQGEEVKASLDEAVEARKQALEEC